MKILYGPPGTGKTWQAAREAVRAIEPARYAAAQQEADPVKALRELHESLVAEGRILWVTFHPSYSYEDFVEGYRPIVDETGQLAYRVVDGPFKSLCLRARFEADLQIGEPLFLFVDEEEQSGVVRLRPDSVLTRGGKRIAIADAKWKRASESGVAHGIKREDFYQIHAYLTRYKVSEAVILVPKAPWMPGTWTKSYRDADTNAQVHLVGVDVEGLVSRSAKAREASYKLLTQMLGSVLPA